MKKFLLLFYLLLFTALQQVNAQVCFTPYVNYPSGVNPTAIVSSDFNGDTILDLATSNGGSNNISVFLGDGIGGFSSATNFTVGTNTQPKSIACADFNGDGKMDMATANYVTNNISVMLGTGTGSFSFAANFSVSTGPTTIICADFNIDGKTDLALTTSNGVSMLLGNGAGGFGVASTFTAFASAPPVQVISADFNGDLNPDLATANTGSNNVSVLLGTGTGSFSPSSSYSLTSGASGPSAICSGDFNGDGKNDLATCDYSLNQASVLLGTGTGSFGSPTNFASGLAGPISIISADFDGDNKKDLAIANSPSSRVAVLLGAGNGSFGAATIYSIAANAQPRGVINGDFNGDLREDIALACINSNNATVMLNCGMMGIDEISSQKEISLYPNPTSEKLIIEIKIKAIELKITDVLGGEVFRKSEISEQKIQIDVSNLKNGIYFLKIYAGEKSFCKKVIVQH